MSDERDPANELPLLTSARLRIPGPPCSSFRERLEAFLDSRGDNALLQALDSETLGAFLVDQPRGSLWRAGLAACERRALSLKGALRRLRSVVVFDTCVLMSSAETSKKSKPRPAVTAIARDLFHAGLVPAIVARELRRIVARDRAEVWRREAASAALNGLEVALANQSWLSPWLRVESFVESAVGEEDASVRAAANDDRAENDDQVLSSARRAAESLGGGNRAVAVLLTDDNLLRLRTLEEANVVALSSAELAQLCRSLAAERSLPPPPGFAGPTIGRRAAPPRAQERRGREPRGRSPQRRRERRQGRSRSRSRTRSPQPSHIRSASPPVAAPSPPMAATTAAAAPIIHASTSFLPSTYAAAQTPQTSSFTLGGSSFGQQLALSMSAQLALASRSHAPPASARPGMAVPGLAHNWFSAPPRPAAAAPPQRWPS